MWSQLFFDVPNQVPTSSSVQKAAAKTMNKGIKISTAKATAAAIATSSCRPSWHDWRLVGARRKRQSDQCAGGEHITMTLFLTKPTKPIKFTEDVAVRSTPIEVRFNSNPLGVHMCTHKHFQNAGPFKVCPCKEDLFLMFQPPLQPPWSATVSAFKLT